MRATVVLGAVAIVVTGIVDPRIAGTLALVTACLAVGAAVLTRDQTPLSVVAAPIDPFGPERADDAPFVETPDVTELARDLAQADKRLPSKIAAELRAAASGRLLDEHRLDLRRDEDRRSAASMLSPELAAIVLEEGPDVPVRHLDRLIEEVERL